MDQETQIWKNERRGKIYSLKQEKKKNKQFENEGGQEEILLESVKSEAKYLWKD